MSFFLPASRPLSNNPTTLHSLPLKIKQKITRKPCQVKGLKGDCWAWTAFCFQGYGRLRMPGFKTRKAHRIIYEIFNGPIAEGLETDHLCLNPSCVNPAHLEIVT